jgi:hypothetical protein
MKKRSMKRFVRRYYAGGVAKDISNITLFQDWNEYSAYFLGFILATGKLIRRGSEHFVIITTDAYDVLEELQRVAGGDPIKELYPRSFPNEKLLELTITDQGVVSGLRGLGFKQNGRIDWSSFDPHPCMANHVLRGFTDGSCRIAEGTVILWSTRDERFALWIKEELKSSCNVIANPYRYSGSRFWEVRISGDEAVTVMIDLYEDAEIYLVVNRSRVPIHRLTEVDGSSYIVLPPTYDFSKWNPFENRPAQLLVGEPQKIPFILPPTGDLLGNLANMIVRNRQVSDDSLENTGDRLSA